MRLLRRSVGVIGLGLPFVLAVGNDIFARRAIVLNSLSAAYFTDMRDVFVGSMSAIGVFLICYRYAKPDEVVTTIAGVLAIVVALFHTTPDDKAIPVSSTGRLVALVHLSAAGALLLLMAYICLFLFTRTNPAVTPVTRQKHVRNGIYYGAGLVIIVSLLLAGASYFLPPSTRAAVKPLFWLESLAVIAFGVAWLVKGETIFKDAQPNGPAGVDAA